MKFFKNWNLYKESFLDKFEELPTNILDLEGRPIWSYEQWHEQKETRLGGFKYKVTEQEPIFVDSGNGYSEAISKIENRSSSVDQYVEEAALVDAKILAEDTRKTTADLFKGYILARQEAAELIKDCAK
jgi:hypothetical protein